MERRVSQYDPTLLPLCSPTSISHSSLPGECRSTTVWPQHCWPSMCFLRAEESFESTLVKESTHVQDNKYSYFLHLLPSPPSSPLSLLPSPPSSPLSLLPSPPLHPFPSSPLHPLHPFPSSPLHPLHPFPSSPLHPLLLLTSSPSSPHHPLYPLPLLTSSPSSLCTVSISFCKSAVTGPRSFRVEDLVGREGSGERQHGHAVE